MKQDCLQTSAGLSLFTKKRGGETFPGFKNKKKYEDAICKRTHKKCF